MDSLIDNHVLLLYQYKIPKHDDIVSDVKVRQGTHSVD